MSKLSPSQQSAVLGSNVARSSPDDDGDGLPNAAEHAFGTNVCGHDTHGDGNSDATQREAKGVITAVSADNPLAFPLRDGDWLASDTTVFEHGTSANLTAGACVEANGTLDSATNVVEALSVEFKPTSECRR